MAESYFILYMYHLFIILYIDGHLGCLCILPIVKNAVNIMFFFDKQPKMEMLGPLLSLDIAFVLKSVLDFWSRWRHR